MNNWYDDKGQVPYLQGSRFSPRITPSANNESFNTSKQLALLVTSHGSRNDCWLPQWQVSHQAIFFSYLRINIKFGHQLVKLSPYKKTSRMFKKSPCSFQQSNTNSLWWQWWQATMTFSEWTISMSSDSAATNNQQMSFLLMQPSNAALRLSISYSLQDSSSPAPSALEAWLPASLAGSVIPIIQ